MKQLEVIREDGKIHRWLGTQEEIEKRLEEGTEAGEFGDPPVYEMQDVLVKEAEGYMPAVYEKKRVKIKEAQPFKHAITDVTAEIEKAKKDIKDKEEKIKADKGYFKTLDLTKTLTTKQLTDLVARLIDHLNLK